MNETSRNQLLCIASVDFAFIGTGDRRDGEGLFADAMLSGREGWSRLLKAAKLQEDDDLADEGYLLKAWAIDPTTGMVINFKCWTDLCFDQVERIRRCL